MRTHKILTIFILLALITACSDDSSRPTGDDSGSNRQESNAVDAATLTLIPESSWSPKGWNDIRWNMGPGDAIPLLNAKAGYVLRPSEDERHNFLGRATEFAYVAELHEPIHGQEVEAILKFSGRDHLFGILLLTPTGDFGLTRRECSDSYRFLQAGYTEEYGPGKEGVTFVNDTPRTEWLSDGMRLKLTHVLNTLGCFIQVSYMDPDFDAVLELRSRK